MILIDPDGFSLRIVAQSYQREEPGGPYMEWIDMRVEIDVPGIQARGDWRAMPDELRQFGQQLEAMRRDLVPGASAVLESVERGLRVALRMTELGGVIGEWHFQPQGTDGATAHGKFAIDQSYLEGVIRAVEDLASFTGCSSHR